MSLPAAPHRSSAGPLAVAYAVLILYASLYPLAGWRWPPGLGLPQLLALPWPPWREPFDIWANLLGYLPLGALVYGAAVRNGVRTAVAMGVATALPALLSYLLEVTQNFVPARVPSRVDWALNAAGGVAGAVLAAVLERLGVVVRWQRVRDRWFMRHGAGALVLLLLWPVGLLFPAPVPLGLGQAGPRLRELAAEVLRDTPWADDAAGWLVRKAAAPPLPPLAEGAAIALGLLAPCLVAFAVTRPGWRRMLLAGGAAALALATTTLSTALNFAPQHALAWITPATLPALAIGLGLAVLCARIGSRTAAGLGLAAVAALVMLVARAPADPYYASSLQAWEQGRFIRFHGLAQWVGWLWPYLAAGWLLWRVTVRQEGPP